MQSYRRLSDDDVNGQPKKGSIHFEGPCAVRRMMCRLVHHPKYRGVGTAIAGELPPFSHGCRRALLTCYEYVAEPGRQHPARASELLFQLRGWRAASFRAHSRRYAEG